eukprot:NODE_1520_length_1475_cov_27.909496_g1441_i0.p1 GENE.NODE_1520_length_1475_cov_27.909496_g1441_i0~~NODE_1520_length_1475_cov_27.909496_g1441_i0.p1  ORF type:complete len:490 (+),score=146.23 NODE_1520_length_1475_cov_27.909496_g1441_i0:78-1472(+)
MSWFLQMGLAVKYMHDNKILHRDLKSANIFLTKENLVKIGDFGFGKILANTIAQAKTLCGTPYYFSPELCMGKPYNNKSDIWALGCILAEMCVLGHAYDAKNIKDLMRRVTKGTYQTIPTCYSTELQRLIQVMLTKDQLVRPNIKSIFAMDFVQAKLRAFAQVATQPSVTSAAPVANSNKEVAEMEAWAQDHNPKLPPKEKRQARKLSSTDTPEHKLPAMKEERKTREELKEFLKGPPPEEVKALATPKPNPRPHTPVKDSLDQLVDATILDSSTSANPSRSVANPTTPKTLSAPRAKEPKGEAPEDVFDEGEADWKAIAPLKLATTAPNDFEEFGSMAVFTEGAHNSLMEHVNQALSLRPGTAERKRRAEKRAAGASPRLSPIPTARRELEDFSDTAATLGSQNLRTLLITELGSELFDKVYNVAATQEDDDAAMQRIDALVGRGRGPEIAPLMFKLVLNERE